MNTLKEQSMSRINIDIQKATTEQYAAQILKILRENAKQSPTAGYHPGSLLSILHFEFSPVALGMNVRDGGMILSVGAFSYYGPDRVPEWLRKKYAEAVHWLRRHDFIMRDHRQSDDDFVEVTSEGASIEIDQGSMSFVISRAWKHWRAEYEKGVFLLGIRKNGQEFTGTAFLIGENLFATCEHNFVGDVVVYLGDTAVPVGKSKKHATADVALFSLEQATCGIRPLSIQTPLPAAGDEVAILGFPVVPLRLPILNFCAGMIEALPTDYKANQQFIQVSVATAGGYSGGPLIDTYGRVIGIVSERTFESVSEAGLPARPFSQVVPTRYLAELL